MTIVETSNGRSIECDKITFEVKQTGYWAHLYRDDEDNGGEYEYEMIHISMITRIYNYKED